jgi:hypothetical protein
MLGLREILAPLGTVRNPVLFSSSSFSIILMYFSRDFVLASHMFQMITGLCMFLLSVLVFLTGLAFYAYAYFALPSSTQELVFMQEGKKTVQRHARAASRKMK